jgi:colanic acid biosynthesis protein WcaH
MTKLIATAMDTTSAIRELEASTPNPTMGLPLDIFLFISSRTPLVNVDLLIQDENRRTLLAWRDDAFSGKGWHVPGGIVRSMETLETRIQKVAETEIGLALVYDPLPIALNQIISPQHKQRNHFVSFLYRCSLPATFIPNNRRWKECDPGFLAWHEHCPANLIACQEIYRRHIG